jgi:SAM-dependent methyltransferase
MGEMTIETLDTMGADYDPFDQTDEQKAFHALRFPELDAESQQNFVVGFRNFLADNSKTPQALAQRESFLRSKGFDPAADTDLGFEQAAQVMLQDPVFAARTRLQVGCQMLMWDRARRVFHRAPERYLAAMEATDNAGPGSLELNPDLDIPHYARYEIHEQPGGFVGDPFAGWLYHHAVNLGYYQGLSDHEEIHLSIAKAHRLPRDGQMRRALDMGCGTGQSTTAIKERFPNAEVWGIDVGGPMVRYAHHRAATRGIAVHFAQRLAEDCRFPDAHFDMVTDHIMFHEIAPEFIEKAVAEIYRVLRPGGVFNHVELGTIGHPKVRLNDTVAGKAGRWLDSRLNVEPWKIAYTLIDFPAMLRKVGFDVDLDIPSNRWNRYPGVLAIKPE